jgi:hypothetical protein
MAHQHQPRVKFEQIIIFYSLVFVLPLVISQIIHNYLKNHYIVQRQGSIFINVHWGEWPYVIEI